jgi:hypothetical protein
LEFEGRSCKLTEAVELQIQVDDCRQVGFSWNCAGTDLSCIANRQRDSRGLLQLSDPDRMPPPWFAGIADFGGWPRGSVAETAIPVVQPERMDKAIRKDSSFEESKADE